MIFEVKLIVYIVLVVIGSLKANAQAYYCANDSQHNCNNEARCTEMKNWILNKKNNWKFRYPVTACAYKEFNCTKSVEIGVASGGLSYFLLETIPSLIEHHGVDPFVGNYDPKDDTSNWLGNLNASTLWSRAVLDILQDHGCRFRFHYGTSSVRVVDFVHESIDCIFVDGDHTYEGVMLDIKLWMPVLKVGGLMIFDDYSYEFPGVIKAVNQLVGLNKLTLMKYNGGINVMITKPIASPINFNFDDFENEIIHKPLASAVHWKPDNRTARSIARRMRKIGIMDEIQKRNISKELKDEILRQNGIGIEAIEMPKPRGDRYLDRPKLETERRVKHGLEQSKSKKFADVKQRSKKNSAVESRLDKPRTPFE